MNEADVRQSDHPSATYNTVSALRHDAVNALRSRSRLQPELALILGSGLGPLADEIQADAVVPYADIPGFGRSSAPGHAGELVLGELAGKQVVAMRGRLHYYEGFSSQQLTFPVRVMHALGARSLL
ncbi:MAG TPA: hypothetical protein VF171_08315, partial [Trueperaceae bacterium]